MCVPHSYTLTPSDGLRTIYRVEGTRGLYKGSLLALVGVSNGSIQFASYEEIKRRRTDLKRKLFASQGKEWKLEDEKLVSLFKFPNACARLGVAPQVEEEK